MSGGQHGHPDSSCLGRACVGPAQVSEEVPVGYYSEMRR